LVVDLPGIDEITEWLVTIHRRDMVSPFSRIAAGIGGEFNAAAAKATCRILTEGSNTLGNVREPVVFIRLPKPV
jgi:hypothetical protein